MTTDSFSFSNTLSKGSVYESDSILQAYRDDAASRLTDDMPESISNERIIKTDIILETYRVESDAIHGGMGSVWRVFHTGWNVDLAMKRPQPRFFAEGSDRRKEEFISECEHWIDLGLHPNIVSCYYVREIGGVPTIFSEWMDGGSLKDAIQSGRLYEGTDQEVRARILDITIQTARGLQYAHEKGLIHQDVKPGNILLSNDWDAKVADFGLARAQSQLTEDEKPVSSGYTLAYCPREQAEGATPEKWMDVYAWALTVVEMYAGRRLWTDGATAAVNVSEYLSSQAERIPEDVRSLLNRAMTGTLDAFSDIDRVLTRGYRSLFGTAYPREYTKKVSDTAASLNNRALSFLDLKREKEAIDLWQQALIIDQDCVDAIYNRQLFRLRSQHCYDFEAIEEILHNKAAKAEDAVRPIRMEWDRTQPLFPDANEFSAEGKASDAVLGKDGILFSVGDQADNKSGRTYLYRVRYDGTGPATQDFFDTVTAAGARVRKIVFHPDGRTAVLILQDHTACLYDMEDRVVLQQPVSLPRERMRSLFTALNDFGGKISPDGRFLVLYENGALEGVLVLAYPSLRVLEDSDKKFVCFWRDGGVLLRSREYVDESLFPDQPQSEYKLSQAAFHILDADGGMREIYRFSPCRTHLMHLADANEWKEIPKAPVFFYRWGWNDKADGIDTFWLDETLEKRPIESALFMNDNHYASVLCYDRDKKLLFTRILRGKRGYSYAVWDWEKQRCLYTALEWHSQAGMFFPLNVLWDGAREQIVAWKNNLQGDAHTFSWSRPAPFPKVTPGASAPWRLSRIVTVSKRIEQEERIHSAFLAFRDACREKRYAAALDIFRACRDIPGFAVSEEGGQMETAVDAMAQKSALRKIGHVGQMPDWPEYTNRMTRDAVLLADGRYVAVRREVSGNDTRIEAQFFRRDGKLLRTLVLEGIQARPVAREGKLFLFDNLLAHRIYDFAGNLIGRAERGPALPPEEGGFETAPGSAQYLDLDLSGTRLLYGVDLNRHAGKHNALTGIFQRDIVTGETIRIDDYKHILDAYQGYGYQRDGTMLVRRGAQIARRKAENGRLLQTYRIGNKTDSRVLVIMSGQRDRAVVYCQPEKGQANWYGFEEDGTRFFESTRSSICSISPDLSGQFAAVGEDKGFSFRDLVHDKVLYAEEKKFTYDVCLRPDGREMYARATYNAPVDVYRVEYEYELPEEEAAALPSSIVHMLEGTEEEPRTIVIEAEEKDKPAVRERPHTDGRAAEPVPERTDNRLPSRKREGLLAALFRRRR